MAAELVRVVSVTVTPFGKIIGCSVLVAGRSTNVILSDSGEFVNTFFEENSDFFERRMPGVYAASGTEKPAVGFNDRFYGVLLSCADAQSAVFSVFTSTTCCPS